MRSIVLAGVHDDDPQLAICHSGPDMRGVLADWFGELAPDLDFHGAEPKAIKEALGAVMEPSDWTALTCFPLIDYGLFFTGESIGVASALALYAGDEKADPA